MGSTIHVFDSHTHGYSMVGLQPIFPYKFHRGKLLLHHNGHEPEKLSMCMIFNLILQRYCGTSLSP
jgi:hypothetical protein